MKLKRFGALCLSLALTLSMAVLPAHALEFSDVPKDFWGGAGYQDIMKMANKGLAKGYEDGTFKPNGKMTAVETLLFCARATGVDADIQAKIAADSAKEISKLLPTANNMNSWAANEMALAVETGVLSLTELEALSQVDQASVKTDEKGYITSSRTYLEETMSREKICMYLVRAMQLDPLAQSLSNYSLSYKYKDADDIAASLQPYVYVLTNYGIVKGKETGNFDPKGAVTRAEMTTMLCRTLDFMDEAGIVTELSEYTDYDWAGGVITSVTESAGTDIILTLYSEAADTTQSYSVPATAKVYEDNMLTTATSLKNGQYVRLNLNKRGAVAEVRLGGPITSYSGSVAELDDGQISVLTNGQTHTMEIDRFTQIVIGKNVGGRELIDKEAGYTSAVCYVDATGHLAAVRLSGGTQSVEGLVESVTVINDTTTLGLKAYDGTVHRYTVPTGIAVTVDGSLGSLSPAHVGRYAKLRILNESTEARSVAVNTVENYVQGAITRTGTIGSAKSVFINDIFTGKTVTYTVSPSAAITFNGEARTLAQVESGWYVTVLAPANVITQMFAYPGSITVEGTLTAINYGSPTTIQVTKADGSIAAYTLDLTAPPAINRNNEKATVGQLRTGDKVIVTVRYNAIEKIDATPQTANVSGVIERVTQERTGVSIDVTLSDGSSAGYTVTEGVSVTQNNSASNIYSLMPGQSIDMVTDGDDVISINITAAASSSTELEGKVMSIVSSSTNKYLEVMVTDSLGKTTLVKVDIKNAALLDLATGDKLTISSNTVIKNSIKEGEDTVRAFGSYDGSVFIATIVIRQ